MSRAFALAVLAVGLLSGMDAMIKAQAAAFSTPQIVLMRFVFGSLAILGVAAVARPPRPRLDTILANSWRAVLGVSTALTFYYALGRLPLAETLALSLLSPCFTVVFGALLLRETVGRPIVIALIIGFLGMLLIVAPNFGGASASALEGTVAVLVSTVTYSLSLVLLRSRATRDHPMTIVAVQNLGSLLILGLLAPFAPAEFWQPVTMTDLVNFAAIGCLGIGGHLVIAKAYSLAPAARMAPADYTSMIYAVIFGYIFFAETPAWTTIAGALLIIASSLAATRR
ncbi:EamA-like transporter family protein [Rhizobiales bacterium GAS113]|nr:EamA-like transporter family protein [Rhizobiales bacterium GAS113]